MATKSKTREEIKKSKIQAIENNINLIEILHYYFRGQVLEMDLKDFCLRFNIYETERQFQSAVKKLVSKDVLKIEKLVNTNNNVIIAKGIVYTYFGEEGKTTRYSVDTVVKNSYLNYIFQNRTDLDDKLSIEENARNIAEHSTFFATKRDVMSCYNMFKPYLSPEGEVALGDSLYTEEKRKVALKNVQKADMEERAITYEQTLQTLRERDIYISRVPFERKGEGTFWRYKVFLLDTNSAFTLANISSKIALTLRVIYEHLDHEHMDKTVDFIICAKNEETKKRLERNFVTPRKNREADINLDKAINKALNVRGTRVYMEYEFKRKAKSKGGQMLHILENIYRPVGKKLQTIRINVDNIDVGTRHNADLKTKALIDKKAKESREKQRDMVIDILARNGLLREGLTDGQIKYIKEKIEV